MAKVMVSVYVRPEVKARLAELTAHFGAPSLTALIEAELDLLLEEMDKDKIHLVKGETP